MRDDLKVLEGFAGPGGLSEAAAMLGISDVVGVETNTDACATARAAGHKRLQADIRDLDPADFPATKGWLSAPPCPTYCASGKQSGRADYDLVLEGVRRLGDSMANAARDDEHRATYGRVADERTALVLETLKLAFRLPKLEWMVAEQVPAVHGIWAEVCAELAAAYDWQSCNVVKIRADDLGAATRRERVILIATRWHTPDFTGVPLRARWSCGRFEAPQVHGPQPGAEFPRVSMAQALDYPAGVRINTRGNRRTAGGNEFSADQPAVSMTGNGLRAWYRTDLGKPAGLLTPAQAGLLQGFPADYPWHGSRSSQFQRIADTVSPMVGAAVIGAATGLDWQPAVRRRLAGLYRHTHITEARDLERQLDLFDAVPEMGLAS
ncbi:MAG: DNA cytosine methyltransferase [Actinoallomurus sp.]